MTGIQSRDESVGDTSDDEPLSKTLKPGKKGSEDASSDIVEDASPKKPLKEPTSTADECPGHSSDDEPLSKLNESKGAKRSSKQQETDARKTRSPKKRKAATKASRIRVSSPSPSRSPAKVTQRRGRKGKDNSKKKASGHSPATNTTPKRRGRAKKEGKACSDSSDDEPSSEPARKKGEPARKKGEPARKKGEPARKKGEPEMKQAVVLLERMSEQDVMDAVARGGAHTHEQKSAARADASSDDEPLVRKVKTAKVKDKFRKRANGEEDTVKQDKELSEEDERPH